MWSPFHYQHIPSDNRALLTPTWRHPSQHLLFSPSRKSLGPGATAPPMMAWTGLAFGQICLSVQILWWGWLFVPLGSKILRLMFGHQVGGINRDEQSPACLSWLLHYGLRRNTQLIIKFSFASLCPCSLSLYFPHWPLRKGKWLAKTGFRHSQISDQISSP